VDERGETCSVKAEMRKPGKTLNGTFKGGENLGDLGVNGSLVFY
jgi:hypothetical protein